MQDQIRRETTRWKNDGQVARISQEELVHSRHVDPLHPVTDKETVRYKFRRCFIAYKNRGHEFTPKMPTNRGRGVGKDTRNVQIVRVKESEEATGTLED